MKSFSNILVVADTARDESAVLKRATALASDNQALLTLVSIVDEVPPELRAAITAITPSEITEIAVSEKQDQLAKIAEKISTKGARVETKVLVGKPFIEIIRQVLTHGYDLVIKGVDTPDVLNRVFFGSTDMHLMRKCPCPVWMIKTSDHAHYRRVLAAVDRDSDDAERDALNRPILEMATSLALAESSELHIVHVWDLYGESFLRARGMNNIDEEVDAMVHEEEKSRRKWLQRLVDEYGSVSGKDAIDYLAPQQHLEKGYARHVVPRMARELDVDVIIMGTVARTGIPGLFMGNTAENILNQIDCSVLAIKPPGFVSPVSV